MQFFFPWLLLGSLGISVPITIHLLNRYRFKQVEWGAMELLRRALIVRSRRIKLEDWLLLALRCLIILLLALALARPVLTPQGTPWLGKGDDAAAVIALDASFSMTHCPGSRSRFDRATDRVREIAKTLKPGNPVTLVLLGDRPRFLLRNEAYAEDRFEAALKEAQPLPERLNLETCLDTLGDKQFLEEIHAPLVEFYLVSDAQTNTWSPLSDKARQSLQHLGETGKVFFLPVSIDNSENLAITRFDLKTGLVRKGVTVEVEIGNFGLQRRDVVAVHLLVDDVPVDQATVEHLEAGQTETVSLFARLDKVGTARLTARLDSDELLLDNVRHAVVNVRDKTRILYVRASRTEDSGEKDYVLTALRPVPFETLDVDTVNWLDLPGRKLSDYQVVILANVPDLPEEVVRNLYYFAREGGGLIVLPGENVQPDLVNARFRCATEPLLPAELQESLRDSEGWPIELVDHPLSHLLAGLPGEVVSTARVQHYFRLKPGVGSRIALQRGSHGDPLLIEKPLGRGHVVLFAMAPERNWTNLVVEPGLFPILIHETLRFVSRQANEQPFTVSDPLLLPLPVAGTQESAVNKVTFQAPGGTPTLRDVETRDGQKYAFLPIAERAGFWEVRADPALPAMVAAVNVDARESRVQTLTPEALMEVVHGLPVRTVEEGASLEAVVRESRIGKELWKELLWLLLGVLLLEGVLARWFTRKKVAVANSNEN